MIKRNRPVIGITMGDPAGIGPEIILKSFENQKTANLNIIVIGNYDVLAASYDMLNVKTFKLTRITVPGEYPCTPGELNVLDADQVDVNNLKPGKVQHSAGKAAFKCIKKAIELAVNGEIDAVVTAPVNKEALHLAGYRYPGHTEILAQYTGTRDYAMLLYDKKLSVIHVSTHISLLEAIRGLDRKRIEKVIELADVTMEKICGKKPRIAVAGLNPHAGENGLFGNEEIEIIAPAVRNMSASGIKVEGPVPPDTVFLKAVQGHYDVVTAMYHDQGHIPLKLLGFHSGVNITAGLPIIRTSVDHGTAFEIAWQGKANEASMVEAIKLAAKMAGDEL